MYNLVGQIVGKQQPGRPRSCIANIQMYLTQNDCEWNGSQLCPVVDCGTVNSRYFVFEGNGENERNMCENEKS
jgi:hypothetical protein